VNVRKIIRLLHLLDDPELSQEFEDFLENLAEGLTRYRQRSSERIVKGQQIQLVADAYRLREFMERLNEVPDTVVE
jgi:hypothetical protein